MAPSVSSRMRVRHSLSARTMSAVWWAAACWEVGMVRSRATTVDEYLASLPADRRGAVEAVREVIRTNLPDGYVETVGWGMLTYEIPLERYPHTYNGAPLGYVALASLKSSMTLYLMDVYGDPATERWFIERYKASGKKLDMGKSCVHFRRLQDLPLDLIGEVVARTPVDAYIARYEAVRRERRT